MRILLLLLLLPLAAVGQTVDLLVDPTLSPEVGAQALRTVRAGIEAVEDRALPLRLGAEETAAGKALGVAYRLGRFALLDEPLAWLTVVTQHEVFGHGARYREFGWDQTGYRIEAPFPYGPGGGAAFFRAPDGFTSDARGTSALSGSHASTVLADAVLEDAFARGRLPYRDATLYLIAALDVSNYLVRKGEAGEAVNVRNDAASWRAHLNARAERLGLDDRVSLEEAQATALTALLDPMLYVSAYAVAKGYLWDGAPDLDLPMIRVGEVGYLPALRFGWGPHGGEVMLDHRLRRGDQSALVRMRWAAPSIETAWGLGASVPAGVRLGEVTVGGALDVWSQPALRLDPLAPERETGGGLGGAARATAYVPLPVAGGRLGAVAELGAKTAGFVGAEPLDAGPIVRVGLRLRAPERRADGS